PCSRTAPPSAWSLLTVTESGLREFVLSEQAASKGAPSIRLTLSSVTSQVVITISVRPGEVANALVLLNSGTYYVKIADRPSEAEASARNGSSLTLRLRKVGSDPAQEKKGGASWLPPSWIPLGLPQQQARRVLGLASGDAGGSGLERDVGLVASGHGHGLGL